MSGVGSFNTEEVRFSDQHYPQNYKVIYFPKKYVAPPRLPIGLTSVDMKGGTDLRIRAYADPVQAEKFTAHIDTWGDSTLYSAGFNYLIEKPGDLAFQSGEFEDSPSTNPRKETSHRINFDRPFVTPPKVIVFLKAWEMSGGEASRLRTFPSDIDAKGFTLHFETWGPTALLSGVAGWIAYPEDKEHIYSGAENTGEVRPWEYASKQTHSDVVFQDTEFPRPPIIFFALSHVDIDSSKDFRIKTYVDNVSTKGMTWHIDSWADTRLWSATVSYIAFT